MDKLFNYLNKKGIDNPTQIQSKILEKMPLNNVIELLEQCFILSNQNSTFKGKPSLFDFVVNESLSGGSVPCGAIKCRTKQVIDLIKFSILYSDSVLISNPFDFFYNYNFDFKNAEQEYFFRIKFLGSLLNISLMKPLIENRKIRINNTIRVLCSNCKKRVKKAEEKIQEKLWKFGEDKIYSELRKSITLQIKDGALFINGLGEYISEDRVVLNFGVLPKEIVRLAGKSEKEIKKSRIPIVVFNKIIREAIDSLMLQKFDPLEGNRFTYLTNNKIETQMIDNLSEIKTEHLYKQNIVNGLAHLIPILDNINLKKLMDFRKNNPDVFVEYQKSLQRAILEPNKCKSEKEFKEALKEIVIPKVNKIERAFQNRHTLLLLGTSTEAIKSLTNLGIGLATNNGSSILSGFIDTAMLCTASCLGQKLIDNEMKENEYYFLWRVNRGL